MNAFLLAAGLGTRLRPLTYETPKCLIDICGKPLLQWWLEKLEATGVSRALINTHYLSEKVRAFADGYDGNVEIELFHENELLGSAGTVRSNRDFTGNDDFLIIYADNLTNVRLDKIIDFHLRKKTILTVGVKEMPNLQSRGVVVTDKNGLILDFVEKPLHPPGKLAFAGVMVASPELFNHIDPEKTPVDFGFDVLPGLVGQMYGYELEGYLQDIGNPDELKLARKKWEEIIEQKQTIVS